MAAFTMAKMAAPPPPPPPQAGPGYAGGVVGGIQRDTAEAVRPPSKTDPAIASLLEQLRRGARPAALPFVREGKVSVQVWLTEASPAALARLKALGFEIIAEPKAVKLVIGRIPLDKLAALVELKFVRYVTPWR